MAKFPRNPYRTCANCQKMKNWEQAMKAMQDEIGELKDKVN